MSEDTTLASGDVVEIAVPVLPSQLEEVDLLKLQKLGLQKEIFRIKLEQAASEEQGFAESLREKYKIGGAAQVDINTGAITRQ